MAANHFDLNAKSLVHAWFVDDFCGTGLTEQLVYIMENIMKWGPSFGYFPSPEKSWLVCSAESEPFAQYGFKAKNLEIQYMRDTRYLGVHIGAEAMRKQHGSSQRWSSGRQQ